MRTSHHPPVVLDVGSCRRAGQWPGWRAGRSLADVARVIAIAAVLPALLVSSSSAAAAGTAEGRVEGVVLSKATGLPVAGATIRLPGLGATATSGRDGRFAFARTFPVQEPALRIEAEVTAPGFGAWTIHGAPIWPNDTLRLHVELQRTAFDHTVRPPDERSHPARTAAALPTGNTCTGWTYTTVPPQTIWVWRTATGVAEEYDMLFYAQHVLPNEWLTSWDPDALAAGAIAVKMYAWYMAGPGHARVGGSDCADVYDDWQDQIFDPTWSAASTDLAVDATFGSSLRKSGDVFPTQYWGGEPDDPCAPITGGEYAGRMSQWGSQNCALEDMVWSDIDTTFYVGSGWKFKDNLLLNASLQSPAMYPWLVRNSTAITRTKGGSYDDTWYLAVAPASGKKATVYQTRAYDGESTALYTMTGGLRCPSSTEGDCSVTFRIVVKDDTGKRKRHLLAFTVPNDDTWRTYTFATTAGMTHTIAEVSFMSYTPFDLDETTLTTPYGG